MKTTILITFVSLFVLASCNGKSKQVQKDSPQTETVDTNKIYEAWEVDEVPVKPS